MTTTTKTSRNDTTSTKPGKRKVVSKPMPKAKPFPVALLPKVMGNYVTEAAKTIGCDPSYVALPLLASLAAAIGNKRVIQLYPEYTQPAIIWGAVIADSSERKSPAFRAGKRFLEEQQDQDEWYDEDAHYLTTDITIAALKDRLNQQENSRLLQMPDELIAVLQSLGSRGQNSEAKGFWLSGWDGSRIIASRHVGKRRSTINIPRASVSIVGTIQPIAFKDAVMKEKYMDDGLCARFLLVWQPPAKRRRWNPRGMSPVTVDAMRDVFRYMFKHLKTQENERRFFIKPRTILLHPYAEKAWTRFYNRHNREAEQLDKHLRAAWGKLEAYTARLALILYLVDDAIDFFEAEYPHPCEEVRVSLLAMQRAIQLIDWFKGQTRKSYRLLAETKQESEQRELVDFIRRRRTGSLTVRDLYRSSSKHNTPQKAQLALNGLVKEGYLRRQFIPAGKRGGQPTERFHLMDRRP